MKKYKLLNKVVLLALLSSFSQANSDGFYIGAGGSIINFGKDSMKVENKDKSRTTYNDIKSSHWNIKAGYQHFDNNRVELYFRKSSLDAKEGDISVESYGINYEWGFSSISRNALLPYISVGLGVGRSSSDKLKPIDDVGIGEASFGIGAHYKFNQNIDIQVGYKRIGTIFDNLDNDKDDDVSAICQNNIMFGMTYKF